MLINILLVGLLTLSGWNTRESDHFVVHYQDEDRYVTGEILRVLETEYERLSDFFEFTLNKSVDVYIHPDQKTLGRHTQVLDLSGWLIGLAVNDAEIHLVSPLNPPGQHTRESVYQALVHELVHICVAGLVDRPLPLWLNEGLAVYLSRQQQFIREVPGWLMRARRLPALADLSDPDFFERNNGYALSYTIVELLMSRFGELKLKDFLIHYPDYSGLGLMSEMQLEREWHTYLSAKYVDPEPLQLWVDHQENVFDASLSPNPLSSNGKLEFWTGREGIFRLRLLDPWGDPVQLLFQRPLKSGFHGFSIDATGYPPGYYYLELSDGSQLQLIRFMKH